MKDQLVLVIGDKNLSSWSMRPWLVLKTSKLKFKEVGIKLDSGEFKKQVSKYSPSGRVPVLIHGGTTVWDSLAICEYVAELAEEKTPELRLWPENAKDRATARSYVAEMHSGFQGLRSQMSMDIKLRMKMGHLDSQTIKDIRRVLELWNSALEKSGGPFLFGDFGIADAFYAPVVMRFVSYGVEIKNARCRKYMEQVRGVPAVKEWISGARMERPATITF